MKDTNPMKEDEMDNRNHQPDGDGITKEVKCKNCGYPFITRLPFSGGTGNSFPEYCTFCQEAMEWAETRKREELEERKRQQKKEQDYETFLVKLKAWNYLDWEQIMPNTDRVLYIIGNGFDLMHGVPSSYYDFYNYIGGSSYLACMLDFFWPEDLWSNFEEKLAHFDLSTATDFNEIDSSLSMFDAYEEDASMASFYYAQEFQAEPIASVFRSLPNRLRTWINTLDIGTEERPLQNMFVKGKVLCFNYTEFVETMYGIPRDNICYIHGFRKKQNEKLIIGHLPGASDVSFERVSTPSMRGNRSFRKEYCRMAQDGIIEILAGADEEITKSCSDILKKHQKFFADLDGIQKIIVIGHSMSRADWDYFRAVADVLRNNPNVHWYVGCYGMHDLENLAAMLEFINVPRSVVTVFRTDTIRVAFLPVRKAKSPYRIKTRREAVLQTDSPNGCWHAILNHNCLEISNKDGIIRYEALMPDVVSRFFFPESDDRLFVIISGFRQSILLFARDEQGWHFVGDLIAVPEQKIIRRTLLRVVITEDTIIFIYKRQILEFSLLDGKLLGKITRRNANHATCSGEDVSRFFLFRH